MDADFQIARLWREAGTYFQTFCKLITITTKDFANHKPGEDVPLEPVQFNLKQHQIDFVKYLESEGSEKFVVKCRQIGITETLVAYCLWRCLYRNNQKILFVIPGYKRVLATSRKFKSHISSIEKFFGNLIDISGGESATRFDIPHSNSSIEIQTATSKTGRSDTYSLVIVDEFAYIDDPVSLQWEILSAIRPNSSKRIIISTPAREDDCFHEHCKLFEAKGELFKRTIHDVKADWYGSEEHGDLWIEQDLFKNKRQFEINREYLCEFKGAAAHTVWRSNPSWFTNPPTKGPKIFSMDIGWDDDTAILFAYIINDKLYIYDEQQKTETKFVYVLQDMPRGFLFGVMDSNAKKTDITSAISPHKYAEQYLGCRILTHKNERMTMLNIAHNALDLGEVFISPSCTQLRKTIDNYAFDKNGQFPRNEYKHFHDALVYLILNWQIYSKKYRRNSISNIQNLPKQAFGLVF